MPFRANYTLECIIIFYKKRSQLRSSFWIVSAILYQKKTFCSTKTIVIPFLFNDLMSKEKYREIMTIIFSILVIVYFYFYKESVSDINKLKESDTDKKKILTIISSIASLLILISGVIFLIVAILDEDLDVELAFN